MKKSIISGSTRGSILLACVLGVAQAAPYGREGHQTRWTQPNGEVVQLRVFGDEYYGRTETPEGYTVVLSGQTYYYAHLSQDSKSLVASATPANEPAPAALAKHISLPKAVAGEIHRKNLVLHAGDRQKRWSERVAAVRSVRDGNEDGSKRSAAAAKAQAAPFVGNKVGLTILVQFPDDTATTAVDPVTFPTTRDKMVRYCNEAGYTDDGNYGSVRDYFYEQSNKKLTYTQSVTKIITMPRARNWYNFSDYPTNTVFRGNAGQALVNDAITALEEDNFNFSTLSKDNNNYVYATNIFFAGPDSGKWSEGLWPHMSGIGRRNVGSVQAPIYLNAYQITNLDNASPTLSTFCHENGHLILGYPDLYDYQDDSAGAGSHCLMGYGGSNNGGRTPSPINVYFKDISGWATVTNMSSSQFATLNLPTTGNRAVRIRKPGSTTEYFIVENRGVGDRWADHSVDTGIAIWHIDETKNGNSEQQMTAAEHFEVSLEQADGKFDLENDRNLGDNKDLFDLETPAFTNKTMPNSKWWSGAASGVEIRVLSPLGRTTEVLIGSVLPNTILIDSPNGGETVYPASNYRINWRANIKGKVRIDLMKGGKRHSVISSSEENDGEFMWNVPAGLVKGSDYTVRIKSLTNTVPATTTSAAPFTVTDATFPLAGAMPHGWFKPASANTGWTVTKKGAYEGTHSLVTKPTGDGKVAGMAYRSNFLAGRIGFYMKVSTEQGFDYGRFYIDGVRQTTNPRDSARGMTGNIGWQYFSFPVSAGNHTFMWTYEKDDSYGGVKDLVWVDGVSLPPTTQEISVQKPVGTELSDGTHTALFADTVVGSKSGEQTFTIKNSGKADLSGIAIVLNGEHKGDFVIKGPGKTSLAPGRSATFSVRFSPTAPGARKAVVRIRSNDADEGNFGISLSGKAVGLPKIGVSQPVDTKLTDDGKSRAFGFAVVGTTGKTKTFTIRNSGQSVLSGLSISKTGSGRKDFKVKGLAVTSLAPGASTTFTVTFSPTAKNARQAVLHIASNDKKTGVFDIKLNGKGAPKGGKASAVAASSRSASGGIVEAVLGKPSGVVTTTTVEVVRGTKYLSLTVNKTGGASPGTVEVSSNLLDWYSGTKHTTVLVDDATTLKVRDNTPVTPDAKRHIRLK